MIIPLKTRFLDLNEEEFFQFCGEVDDVRIEREADGTIILRPLRGTSVGSFCAEVATEMGMWNRASFKGKAFGANAGFTLPNKAVRSPDVSWIALERWLALLKDDQERFAHISPDFVIEIRSETDSLDLLKTKMIEYQQNGVRLGWLIDPQEQQVWIYRLNGTVEHVGSFDIPLSGEDVLEGFEMRLSELWEG